MTRSSRSSNSLLIGLTVSAIVPILLYVFLQAFPGHNTMWVLPRFHFYFISSVLILATICSIIIGWTGARIRDLNVLMLALAILSLSGFFLIHGLSTPGFIISDSYHLAGVSSQIAMTTCAVWILLSTLPADYALIRYVSKHRGKVVIGWLTLIAALNIVSLVYPDISDFIPVDFMPLNYSFAFFTVVLFVRAAKRYFQQYQFARFPIHAAMVLGSVLLSITELIMVTTRMWTLAWWLYHVVLVVSTAILLYGVIAQYKSNVSITRTFHQVSDIDPMERIRISISNSMQKLIIATETKDAYTAGHNFRVAMYALQLAEAMNLEPELLKALVRGGLIHDVGKIQVPESILNKPGKLSAEERAVIEQHPVTGYEICKYIGFMAEELSVIRHHHEKWDGTGYPDKLKDTQIPLLARVLAVADVYDALTSRRSYREPWSHERAMRVIEDDAGSHFDPDCVKAWVRLCNSGRFVIPDSAHNSIFSFHEVGCTDTVQKEKFLQWE
ncbi:HD-GYP domain-containing protein [Fodinisporobacter ferrooxydans]|uniref:HD-GYP domain-containing protein n=1 Tax=Fodinisporobacter ferrooxydans TaxID=2901836 RepID=A0ABY4CNC9_9BACL|nr:HD-GYP domain-containing protein [Alicyclobacillaceae bacterium MYW30-H2]